MNDAFAGLDREELLGLLEDFARNWLAHDGVWFQAVEAAYGLEAAIAADAEAWERFAGIEARRIRQRFGIPDGGGLDALAAALPRRMYALLNRFSLERPDPDTLRFTMRDCRVQSARSRKGLPAFPCKPVGLVEYSSFARGIDPGIEVRCLGCPPDELPEDTACAWEFRMGSGA